MPTQVPEEVAKQLSQWNRNATLYMTAGYLAVAVGILSSLAVTAFADTLPQVYIRILTFVAAACTGLLASFRPLEAGSKFRAAWRVLRLAVVKYSVDENQDPAGLVAAIDEGLRILSSVPMPAVNPNEQQTLK